MRISILIPAHNEERSITACVLSCLKQTRKPDEILVVNDGSTDRTGEILKSFGDKIRVLTIPIATGNKSHAQEYGLKFITSDVFIATDGDTILDPRFVEYVEEDFRDKRVMAIGGYVRSMKYNWLTACRAFEYAVGQNLHKLAQSYIGFLFVIPGVAGAFRTKEFLKYIAFDHDTLTEDLDFTYRLHKLGMKIFYDRRIVAFTQDPVTLGAYVNQVRRWFGGGWQCLIKHWDIAIREPKAAAELTLLYSEGIIFSVLLIMLPLLSLRFFATFILSYFIVAMGFAIFAFWHERRWEMLIVPIPFLLLVFINAYVFLEQMVKEVVLRKKNLNWFKPERVNI
ncbi:glycosyltransferase [Candidatus Parcubacteria bacterium]|nr:MAG: glycosyltransferase [Candidatus Parcubacteria bacterium]